MQHDSQMSIRCVNNMGGNQMLLLHEHAANVHVIEFHIQCALCDIPTNENVQREIKTFECSFFLYYL